MVSNTQDRGFIFFPTDREIQVPGGGGALTYIGSIGMCGP